MEYLTKHGELLQEKKNLYNLQYEYNSKIKEIQKLLDINQINISRNCLNKHGKHNWIETREDGIYGERFYICENCGTDY